MPKPNDGTAEDMVLSNLGMSRDDLGMDKPDGSLGSDAGSESDADDSFSPAERGQERDESQEPPERRQRQEPDDLRDSHSEQQQRPFAAGAEVRPDGKGNLVDGQGNLVARAGREARLYQTAYKRGEQSRLGGMQHQLNERTGQLREAASLLQELNTEVKSLKAGNKSVEDLGIPANKRVEAFTLYKNLTDDFAGTLKRLLTRAAANGINIGEFGNAGPDVKALADLVKDEVGKLVKPLQDRSEEQRRREEVETRQRQQYDTSIREVNTFFDQNRDAAPYARVLQKLAEHPDYRGKSLNEMWLAVQLHLARNPYQRRQQNPGGSNSRQSRSLPAGRGQPERGNSQIAPVNATYDEILRDVFREQGIV